MNLSASGNSRVARESGQSYRSRSYRVVLGAAVASSRVEPGREARVVPHH